MIRVFRNKLFWGAVFIIIASLVSMNLTSSQRENLTGPEKAIRYLYTPVQSSISGFRPNWGGITSALSDKKALNEKIRVLEEDNRKLKLENQVLKEDEAELKRLRKVLNFKNASLDTYDLLPAMVISRNPNNWSQTLTIDKGSNDGILRGMTVITPEGLVGSVGNVNNNSAQINLITDREAAVGSTLQESRETNGIAEGRGNSEYLGMIDIPYYSSIKNGNRVVTSGLSSSFPKGIYIGKISKLIREPSGLLLSANIKPAVDFNKLEEVLVVTGYRPVVENESKVEE
ncbi:MAG: rod shape-determining protein MreC [Syntrophomonas sp.]